MNDDFLSRLAGAAKLMRAGSLGEATAAIQQALGAAAAPVRDDNVIDVEARVVGGARSESKSAPAAAAAAGTAAAAAAKGESFTSGHFKNEAGARDYKLFEPARDGRALPLVLMLHGCTQDPDDFARGTRMNALARAQGALVLYPSQSQRANAQRCWNWFKHNHQARGKGEPAILAGMVRDVVASHAVDPTRVYVAGMSAGGAMAAILGDAYPDLFAAVGVHSGLPTGSATDVQGALAAMRGGAQPVRRSAKHGATPPTIVFHGDADSTVNAVNGERVLQAMDVSSRPETSRAASASGVQYTRRVYRDGRGAERAEQWTIHGVGHVWSGGDATGSYTDPRGPDASAEMLRFFMRHPMK